MRHPAVTALLASAALLLTAGCSSGGGDRTPGGPTGGTGAARTSAQTASVAPTDGSTPPAEGSVEVVRTVTKDLNSPWGLAPLPDGNLLVSSRDKGTIVRVDTKTGRKTELGEVPGVSPNGEGGLLGLALSPEFASDHMIYAYFTSVSDNRIARMVYDPKRRAGDQLGAPDVLLRGIRKAFIHNGGRIAFGPDGMLYVSTGESGEGGLSQNRTSLNGKILRLTPEGEPAPGNPFPHSPVYSYGHRNVQGLAWDPERRLFASEFGQDTWDELNHIKAGGNYGWPDVEGRTDRPGFQNPIDQWRTADASPSGIAWADGCVWMAGLRGERLWRIPLHGSKEAGKPQAFLKGRYGRLRTVVSAGGDRLWLVTSNTDGNGTLHSGDDRILELRVR